MLFIFPVLLFARLVDSFLGLRLLLLIRFGGFWSLLLLFFVVVFLRWFGRLRSLLFGLGLWLGLIVLPFGFVLFWLELLLVLGLELLLMLGLELLFLEVLLLGLVFLLLFRLEILLIRFLTLLLLIRMELLLVLLLLLLRHILWSLFVAVSTVLVIIRILVIGFRAIVVVIPQNPKTPVCGCVK